MSSINDKYSIKNILFIRAIDHHVIPVPTQGHRVYPCTFCGDKFLIQNSLQFHLDRKSIKIGYKCRVCFKSMVFMNRCLLLKHIRSHSYKTATVNLMDLKIEPLSKYLFESKEYKTSSLKKQSGKRNKFESINSKEGRNTIPCVPTTQSNDSELQVAAIDKEICFECNLEIMTLGSIEEKRALHYMSNNNDAEFTCPVCQFRITTYCGLRAHIRIHTMSSPPVCPECGKLVDPLHMKYPYNHKCEGFKKVKASSRVKCAVQGCDILHPAEYKAHIMEKHVKPVYKCSKCAVACFSLSSIQTHITGHKKGYQKITYLLFFQCQLCPGRLVLKNHLKPHIANHAAQPLVTAFPCWECGTTFDKIVELFSHSIKCPRKKSNDLNIMTPGGKSGMCRVVKQCVKCKCCIAFKCPFKEIVSLPDICPFSCVSVLETPRQEKHLNNESSVHNNQQKSEIICNMCNLRISSDWKNIKSHFMQYHKEHKLLDVHVLVEKLDICDSMFSHGKNFTHNYDLHSKVTQRRYSLETSRQSKGIKRAVKNKIYRLNNDCAATTKVDKYTCIKCGQRCGNKEELQSHVITHRDPCTAYQCLECGVCFAVKPSFSTHLFVAHGISDVESYILRENCYNGEALSNCINESSLDNKPLKENQCKICREQFYNEEDLVKHFRVHGMAFLMTNKVNKVSS